MPARLIINDQDLDQQLPIIDRVLGTVTHAINNDLAFLAGSIELAAISSNTKHQAGLLDETRDSTLAISQRLSRNRAMLRAGGGESAPTDLKSLIDRAIEISRAARPDAPAIEPPRVFPSGRPSIVADQCAVGIAELIFNAWDAVDEPVSIALSKGEFFEVAIRDRGPGMSDDTFERCVEPFFTTRGFPHWGLGLSAAYYAASAHGGGLVLNTEIQDCGLEAVFLLPSDNS